MCITVRVGGAKQKAEPEAEEVPERGVHEPVESAALSEERVGLGGAESNDGSAEETAEDSTRSPSAREEEDS